eukprot:2867759-Rhodomonas_salina.1
MRGCVDRQGEDGVGEGWEGVGVAVRLVDDEGKDFMPEDVAGGVGRDGQTPLHWAVCSGKVDAMKALVEAGADKEAKDKVRGCRGRRVRGRMRRKGRPGEWLWAGGG